MNMQPQRARIQIRDDANLSIPDYVSFNDGWSLMDWRRATYQKVRYLQIANMSPGRRIAPTFKVFDAAYGGWIEIIDGQIYILESRRLTNGERV